MEDSCAVADDDDDDDDDHNDDDDKNEVDVAARYGRRVSQLRDRSESLSLRRNSASMGQSTAAANSNHLLHPRLGSLTQRRPSTLLRVPDEQGEAPEAIVATGAEPHAYPPPPTTSSNLVMPTPLDRVVTADSLKSTGEGTATQPPSPEAEQPQALSEEENDLGQGTILSYVVRSP